ncbi:hypothetical protein [Bowmanella denitrificans]|uniref:hypothetical protein n=1 Tax=Bowmanella denitrificans TaxID=366582 RepID=UPI000C9BC037|nr:hypothetical protein [Bowmanella denitrificans]
MDINTILDQPFTFTRRNQLIPCELRPTWKISLMLIVFGLLAKNNKCSLKKLHVANWVVKSEDHVEEFLFWTKDTNGVRPDIRMEPALDRAIELMIGDKFLLKTDGRLEVTDAGMKIFEKLNEASLLEIERKRLLAIKKYMTEANVERIFKVA